MKDNFMRARLIREIDDLATASRGLIANGYIREESLIDEGGKVLGRGSVHDCCICGTVDIDEGSKLIECTVNGGCVVHIGKDTIVKNVAITGYVRRGKLEIFIGDGVTMIGGAVYAACGDMMGDNVDPDHVVTRLTIGSGSVLLATKVTVNYTNNAGVHIGTAKCFQSRIRLEGIYGKDYKRTSKDDNELIYIDDGLVLCDMGLDLRCRDRFIKIGKKATVTSDDASDIRLVNVDTLNALVSSTVAYCGALSISAKKAVVGDELNVISRRELNDRYTQGINVEAKDIWLGKEVTLSRIDGTFILCAASIRLGDYSTLYRVSNFRSQPHLSSYHATNTEGIKTSKALINVGNGGVVLLTSISDRRGYTNDVSVMAGARYVM